MEIKPIKTEVDYEAAIEEIERLFNAKPDTPEGDRLDVLTTLVEAYEDEHYELPPSRPVEAILYYMESRGLSRQDLEVYIGSRARVSEILNRKNPGNRLEVGGGDNGPKQVTIADIISSNHDGGIFRWCGIENHDRIVVGGIELYLKFLLRVLKYLECRAVDVCLRSEA